MSLSRADPYSSSIKTQYLLQVTMGALITTRTLEQTQTSSLKSNSFETDLCVCNSPAGVQAQSAADSKHLLQPLRLHLNFLRFMPLFSSAARVRKTMLFLPFFQHCPACRIRVVFGAKFSKNFGSHFVRGGLFERNARVLEDKEKHQLQRSLCRLGH